MKSFYKDSPELETAGDKIVLFDKLSDNAEVQSALETNLIRLLSPDEMMEVGELYKKYISLILKFDLKANHDRLTNFISCLSNEFPQIVYSEIYHLISGSTPPIGCLPFDFVTIDDSMVNFLQKEIKRINQSVELPV